jgi:ATPase family associated with various cellular activities (AAA)
MSGRFLIWGDCVRHHMLVPDPKASGAYSRHVRLTGVPTIRRVICRALESSKAAEESDETLMERYLVDGSSDPTEATAEHVNVLDRFPIAARSKPDQVAVRVRESYKVSTIANAAHGRGKSAVGPDGSRASAGDIFIVYDCHSHFRELWREKPDPVRENINSASATILAIRDDVADWIKGAKDHGQLSPPKDVQDKTLLLVTAEALRKCGLNFAKQASLEGCISTIGQLGDDSPITALLKIASHLIIVLDETGGFYIDASKSTPKGSLHYCPNFDGRLLVDRDHFGFLPGKYVTFLGAVARQLGPASKPGDWDIASAVRLGTLAYNFSFKQGLAKNDAFFVSDDPFTALERSLGQRQREKLEELNQQLDKEYLLASMDFDLKQGVKWSRIDVHTRNSDGKSADNSVTGISRTIVREGVDAAGRNEKGPFPFAAISSPYAEFGKIKSIDGEEIDRLLNISSLIEKYLATPEWVEPLSIAVFGPPGSGKSFTVKEIIKEIRPGNRGDPLTFNLAQFSSIDQLTEAFHKVQHTALQFKEEPLVIFDEFDSFFQTDLGWLKFFLAPMQDGLFRGATDDYRVGRAIFLFAGGTCENFGEFAAQKLKATGKNSEGAAEAIGAEEEKKVAELKRAKHPDFLSRLRGHLNIKGINPLPTAENIDPLLKLRRAILLRSLLEMRAAPIHSAKGKIKEIKIRDEIIDAFLETLTYVNGVRSMEAIIQSATWIDGEFVAASLPALDQIGPHASLDQFSKFFGSGSV